MSRGPHEVIQLRAQTLGGVALDAIEPAALLDACVAGPPRLTCSAHGTVRSTTIPSRPIATPPDLVVSARASSIAPRRRRSW
jgi:hypothetical protein